MNKQDELMQFVDRSAGLLKAFPNLFLVKDLNSLCVGFSDSLSCMLNMEKKTLMNRSDYDLPWHQYADIYRDCDKQALQGNRVSALQPLQIKKDKTVIANIIKMPILNEKNETIGILADASILPINSDINSALLILFSYDKKSSIINHKATTNYYLDDYDKGLKLTQREEECLFLLVRGKSAKAIGKLLAISHRTVEVYIDNIKQKMSVTSRDEIIDKAIEFGLLEIIPKKTINSLTKNSENWRQFIQTMSET